MPHRVFPNHVHAAKSRLQRTPRVAAILGLWPLVFTWTGGCQAKAPGRPQPATFRTAASRQESAARDPSAKFCPMGVNCEGPQYVDAIKTSSGFYPIDKDKQKTFALDGHGWPNGDAGVTVFDTRVNMPWDHTYPDAMPEDDSGAYHLAFTGQAVVVPGDSTFTIARQVYHAASKTTTADLLLPKGQNLLVIRFTNTNGGVQNVRLIRPGYTADTKQIFTTPYLNALKPFTTLRFMDFLSMNNFNNPAQGGAYPAATNWADRRLPDDSTQMDSGGKHGEAWEYAADLANETGKDLWINIPISASDNYIMQLATLLHKIVKPQLPIYVEYSNEVWNYGFVQNWWNGAAAKAENIEGGGAIRYAKRTVEISNLFRKVYGPAAMNATIRPVLMWQEYDYPTVWNMLKWIDTTYGPPKNLLYAIGDAAYIDADTTTSVDTILAALQKSSDNSRKMTEGYTYVARLYGLKQMAYEGGVGMNGAGDLDKKLAANRDPRIGPILKRHLLENWFAAGGDLFCYFNLYGIPSQWGTWALIDIDLTKPNTPKYRAVEEIAQTPRPPVHLGVALPEKIGGTVSIDENDFLGSQHKPGTPGQNMWGSPGTRIDYPVHVNQAGTYSIMVETISPDKPGTESVFVDGKELGNAHLPETVAVELQPGLHALWLVANGKTEPGKDPYVTGLGGGKQIVVTRTR